MLFHTNSSIAQRRLIIIYYSPSGNTHLKLGTVQTRQERQSQSEGFAVKGSHFWEPILMDRQLQTPVVLHTATKICQNKAAHRITYTRMQFFLKGTRYVPLYLLFSACQLLLVLRYKQVSWNHFAEETWWILTDLSIRAPHLDTVHRKVVILFFCSISNFSNKEAWLRQTVRGLSA